MDFLSVILDIIKHSLYRKLIKATNAHHQGFKIHQLCLMILSKPDKKYTYYSSHLKRLKVYKKIDQLSDLVQL